MQKNIIYLLFLGIIGLSVACTTTADPTPSNEVSAETLKKITDYGTSKGLTFTKTAEGWFYAITNAKPNGRVPKAIELVKLQYIYTKLDGTVLDSTGINRKIPLSFPYLVFNTDYNNIASYMKEGESATIIFPSTTKYAEPTVFNTSLLSTRNETEQIDEYVKEKFANISLKKTVSGLQYFITKTSASGDTVKIGKNVTVNYAGRFLYQIISTNALGFPIYTDIFQSGSLPPFMVGASPSAVVMGFEEAVKLMKVGDKGTFLLPSSLAYGVTGKGNIAPYAPLLFDIEVTAVK
jgi:FKBP-type peptidyl-prolyl cis-trans isomerase